MSAPTRPWSSPRAAFDCSALSQRFHELTRPPPSRDRMASVPGDKDKAVPPSVSHFFTNRSHASVVTKWVNLQKYTPNYPSESCPPDSACLL